MGTQKNRLSTRIGIVVARTVMIMMTIGIVFVGFTLLTTPWAIPVTVVLWLGGLAIAALGICGELPHDA